MTADYRRYALYMLPPSGSALARFGAAWLGHDPETGDAAEPSEAMTAAIDGALRREATAAPARYGFHATLKAPFRLHAAADAAELFAEVDRMAAGWRAFALPPLATRRIGRFRALVPESDCQPLASLANACVIGLDRFRAPLDDAEIARRREARLTSRQDAYMLSLGYPYVLDEFRVHMTLTGPLDDASDAAVRPVLDRLLAPLLAEPVEVRDVAVMGEPADGGPFRVVRRCPLLPTSA